MDKFQNKYRILSARHPDWDYSSNGAYFITICTRNREHFFGEIDDDKMKFSTTGAIIQGFWYEIPKHFPFVELGEFIVMPNHIHGILILDKNDENVFHDEHVKTGQCPVSTTNNDSTNTDDKNDNKTIGQKRFQNQGKNTISSIVGSFKSICTRHIHATFPHLNFEWQERFWDNIIRNDESFENISNYIFNNPKNWKEDRFFGEDDKNDNPIP